MDVEIEQNDLNQKFLTTIALEWLMYTIVWRNRGDLDTMSLDDLYNNLKVYEPKVQKKSESNYQNVAFISLAKNNSGKGEVNTASIPTASTHVSPASADVAAASISLDTVCAYIASKSNGSQIKYEDINQIDEDDIEEMDIKAPRSQDRGRRENYKQGSKIEESAPKALMAIDGVGWDWSYMANEEENHALVADEEALTKFALMAKSSSSSENEVFYNFLCSKSCKKNTDSHNTKITELSKKLNDSKTNLYHYKLGLSQVEAILVEFKTQEIKFREKIRGLEFNLKNKNIKTERITNELKQTKKEKEGLDSKLIGFESASKDLDTLLGSQRSDKNKEGLGYSSVPLLLLKPSPSIKSNSSDLQNSNSSVSEHGESSKSIMSKHMIKFVKAADRLTDIKTNKVEADRKPSIKYAEMYRNTHKSPKVRGNQRNWNNMKIQHLGKDFVMNNKACFKCGHFDHLAYDCGVWVNKGKSWPKNNYTHKSMSPRTIFHKTDRTPAAVNRTHMNVAQPKRTSFAKPAHSYVRMPFQRKSAVRTQFRVPRVPTVTKSFPLGEGSGTPTEPHHTPSHKAQHSPHYSPSSPSHLHATTETIPTLTPTKIPTLRQYSRRAKRIAQSPTLPTTTDEPASLLRDDSQGEAFPTVSGLEAGHDREIIIKTSALPHDSTPRVTSFDADEGSMQQQPQELTDLYTRLQRQKTEMATKIAAQDLKISNLKAMIKILKDKDKGSEELFGNDTPIKGRSLETGDEAGVEKITERGSNDTKEMVNILTSLDAANILTSGVQAVSVPPVVEVSNVGLVLTGSGLVPTASPIFTTDSVVTPYSRHKCKEKMVESDMPKKKKLQEQINVQMAREMVEQMAREDQRMDEQITRDVEISKIHAEKELQMLIDGLDRNNEVIAKHLQEYEQSQTELTIGEKIELINELVKNQDHHVKILKYQAQQSKPLSKNQQREFYMLVLKSHSGWKTRHFRGMTLKEIIEKFIPVWKQIEDCVHMSSTEEGKRMKRKGLRLEQESAKKMKTSKEVSEEDLKEMMRLVPVEERNYWKIIRLGGHTAVYQFFVDMLKHFDREDLNQLWTLVKETLSIRHASSDKEKELWVELKRLCEPDFEEQLWTHT
nr:ribonuclease H-like domain-containing protein [Tanacetum cinerariifolium]